MGVLILSCSTGAGHDSCAKAIKEIYDAHGAVCDICDSLGFTSQSFSNIVSRGHVAIYRYTPKLFEIGYDFSEKHPAVLDEHSPAYHLLASGTGKLRKHILDNGYDAVICTHVFAGMLVNQMMKKTPLPIKTAFVATDYTCYPGLSSCKMDRYFLPAPALIAQYAAEGIEPEKLSVSTIPIRQSMYVHKPKAVAKKKFGIQKSSTHLVMMSGSMGCGPVKELAVCLGKQLKPDQEMTVVCGTNRRLRKALQEKLEKQDNVHILGFVTDMSQLLDSADLYVTKPGGLSTSEAFAKNLPMAFIQAVAGCETYNRQFFVDMGAAVSAKNVEELSELCANLLSDRARLATMSQAMASCEKKNAAQYVYDTLNL